MAFRQFPSQIIIKITTKFGPTQIRIKGNWNAVHKQIIILVAIFFYDVVKILINCISVLTMIIENLYVIYNNDMLYIGFRNIFNICISHSYGNVFVLVLHFVQFMMLMISERTFYQDIQMRQQVVRHKNLCLKHPIQQDET